MTRRVAAIAPVAALGWLALTAGAGAEVFVYPKPGAGQQALRQDQYECHAWAKTQTRFDPSQPAVAAPGPAAQADVGAATGLLQPGAYTRQAAAVATQAQVRQHASLERYERSYAACMAVRGYQIR